MTDVMPCPFCGGSGLRHVPRELDGTERPALDRVERHNRERGRYE